MKTAFAVVGVLIALILTVQFSSKYVIYILNMSLIYIIVALGLNFLTGYAGQVSLGHAGFLAIGAYTLAILRIKCPWIPVPLGLLASGLLTSLVALGVGLPALRLKGLYLAMATLAFGVVTVEFILQLEHLTGGANGLTIPGPSMGFFEIESDREFFYLVLAVSGLMTVLGINFIRSRFGRALLAIRESEIAAETMGIHLAKYKVLAFIVSAFYTGIAGGLLAHLVNYVHPDGFTLFVSIQLVTMIIIGGMGTILGSIIGAVFVTLIPQVLSGLEKFQIMVYGVVLVVFMIFIPHGVAGLISRLFDLKRI